MLSLSYMFVYLLQSTIKYSTSQSTQYNPFYWKTSAATEVVDYWNHGPVFLPGLQAIYTITVHTKKPDIFPPWITRSTTNLFQKHIKHTDDIKTTEKTACTTMATRPETIIHSSISLQSSTETDDTEKVTYTATKTVALLTKAPPPVVESSKTTLSLVVFPKSTLLSIIRDENFDDLTKMKLKKFKIKPSAKLLNESKQYIEAAAETFSAFLRSLMKMLFEASFSKLSALKRPFTDYVTQLQSKGQLASLGPETNSYITKAISIIKDTPTYALRSQCVAAYHMLSNRSVLEEATDELLNLMDDLYVEAEEEAMQGVLREATQFPDNGMKAEDIAARFVDKVFLQPMLRVTGTFRGNHLFHLMTDIVRSKYPIEFRRLYEDISGENELLHESNGIGDLINQNGDNKGSLEDKYEITENYNENNDRIPPITTFVNPQRTKWEWESSERSKEVPNKRDQIYDSISNGTRTKYLSDYGETKNNNLNENTITKNQNRYIKISNAKEEYFDEKGTPTDAANCVECSYEAPDHIQGPHLKLDGIKRSHYNNELDYLLPKTNKHKYKGLRKSGHKKHRQERDRHGYGHSRYNKRKCKKLKQKYNKLKKILMKNYTNSSFKNNTFTNMAVTKKNEMKAEPKKTALRNGPVADYDGIDKEIEQNYDLGYSDVTTEKGKAQMNINLLLEDYDYDDNDKFKGGQQNVTNGSDMTIPRFRADDIDDGGKETDADLEEINLNNTLDDDKDNIDYRRQTGNIADVFKTIEHTDEEMELKKNLYDAFRHMDFKYPASRRSFISSSPRAVNLRIDSDETDAEAVLKNNIYKAVKKTLNY